MTNKSESSNTSHDKAALRIEVKYQLLTYLTDALLRLGLYKVYGLNTEQISTNLICLVGSCTIPESKTADFFSTEADVMDALKGGTTTIQ